MKAEVNSARLLIVDDERANIELLLRVLEPEAYAEIITTTDPKEAADLIEEHAVDIVLLDLMMPEVDGFDVMEEIQRRLPPEEYLPVLVLTSDHSKDAKRKALSEGATDFLTKPLSPVEVRLRVRNLLETRFLQRALKNHNEHLEVRVRERTADLEEARLQILLRLARAAEYRDDQTGEHTRRVGRRSGLIARELGIDVEEAAMLELVAPLHDVGKIGVPDSILLKEGKLSSEEFEIMKSHTVIGADLLDAQGVSLLERAARIALTHHERWDGLGYPNGLAGEEIPLEGRIVAVADTFDALTNARPYKEAWSEAQALQEIRDNAGVQFDPEVVAALARVLEAAREPVG